MSGYLGGGGDSVSYHGVKVRRAAAYTLAQGAGTVLPWDTEDWDSDGYWTSGDATRLIVPTGLAGKYSCDVTVGTDQTGVALTRFFVYGLKNGVQVPGAAFETSVSTTEFGFVTVSFEVDLAVGDDMQAQYFQANAGPVGRNLDSARSAFSMSLIG